MKKIRNILKTISLTCLILLATLFVFTACTKGITAPENLQVTEQLEITWYNVLNANYYEVSIKCTAANFSHPVSDEEKAIVEETVGVEDIKSTRYNKYSIEDLPEGDYEFKVRAIVSSSKISGWTETIKYHKDYSSGCTYQLINGGTEYAVVKSTNAKGDVYIEDTYKGKPVTQIGKDSFKNKQTVDNIYLGKNIKTIGSSAFNGCKNLKSVTIPEGVTSIGEQAFRDTQIEEIILPSTLTSISDRLFHSCRKLKTVIINEGVKSIGVGAFQNCSSIEEIELPESLTTIDEMAFNYCTALKSIEIPANVSYLGTGVFRDADDLEFVTIAEGSKLKTIPTNLFYGCDKLIGVKLPEGITTISDSAFQGCTAFETVNIPSTVTYIGSYAFSDTKILSENTQDIIYIDDWVIGISDEAMGNSETLGTLTAVNSTTLRAGVKGIASGAFAFANNLQTINMPSSVLYLNESAFFYCKTLYSVYFNEECQIKEIPAYAFAYCAITNLRLTTSNVESIGDYAFIENQGLVNNSLAGVSILPDTVTHVGAYAFYNTGLEPAEDGVIYAGNWIVGYDENANAQVVSIKPDTIGIADYAFKGCKNISTVSGLYNVEYIGIGAFYQCEQLASATLGNNVTEIKPYTFYDCKMLYSVELPRNLTTIGRAAFYRCFSLGNISLTQTKVNTLGDYAFYSCSNMQEIEFNPELVFIGNYAFYGCSRLENVTIPETLQVIGDRAFANCSGLKTVTIEMPLTKLPERMFYKDTSLETVNLPNTVTEIGNYAFYGCTNFKKINLGNVVRIGDYAFYNNTYLYDIAFSEKLTYIGKYAFKGAYNLRSVYLSSNITYIDQHAFYGADMLTIYVETGAKVDNWHPRWNSKFRPVVINCTLSSDKTYLVSLEVADIENLGSNKLSKPSRKGYTFTGWATGVGQPVAYELEKISSLTAGTKLYACWQEGEEEIELIDPNAKDKPVEDTPAGGDENNTNSSDQENSSALN